MFNLRSPFSHIYDFRIKTHPEDVQEVLYLFLNLSGIHKDGTVATFLFLETTDGILPSLHLFTFPPSRKSPSLPSLAGLET